MRDRPRGTRSTAAVALLRMGDGNARHHLQPICAAVAPAQVVVVRPSDQPASAYGPNAVAIDTSLPVRALEVVWTVLVGLWMAVRHRPAHLLSFNGIPYGMATTWIGALTRTPAHVGFVGTETSKIDQRPWLLRLFGPVALATTTGHAMSGILRRRGLGSQIEILGHGVDASRFHVDPTVERDVDVVFVGALIPRKRVDLLLAALSEARTQRPALTAVFVGGGPDAPALHRRSRELGLDDCVRFVGHDPNPESWLKRAKVLLMASSWEGLPFAVVEAMRCGAVPITNDIGTVTDLVVDGVSGIVVATDPTADELATAITDLLDDPDRLADIRAAAEQAAADLTYDTLATWWSTHLAAR